jgi:mono/diheme cytochrome c family protein
MRTATMAGLAALIVTGVIGNRNTDVAAAATHVSRVSAPLPPGTNKYAEVCAACHQPNGAGLEGAIPPLSGSELVVGRAAVPIAIVLHGLQGEVTVKGKTYNSAMAPWASVLTDDDLAATLTYVRSQWGNRAAPITAAQVRAVRTKYASRTAPWTVAELASVR